MASLPEPTYVSAEDMQAINDKILEDNRNVDKDGNPAVPKSKQYIQ